MFDVVVVAVEAGVVDVVAGCVVVVVVTPVVREGAHCLVVVAFVVVGDCHLLVVGGVVEYCDEGCLFVGSCYCCWWCRHDRCRS